MIFGCINCGGLLAWGIWLGFGENIDRLANC